MATVFDFFLGDNERLFVIISKQMETKHIIPHTHKVTSADRICLKGHNPCVIWFTGFSGSGKSTIANEVECLLNSRYKAHTYLLDGDNIRAHLNKDLGFSDVDRVENIRRIGEVCRLLFDAGILTLAAFISPFRTERALVRSLLPEDGFIEVFVKCPLEECESRDSKGLYQKARAGKIGNFTGITSPYEPPLNPELTLDSLRNTAEECAAEVIAFLEKRGRV